MAKQRIKQTRKDGIIQHYTVGKTPLAGRPADLSVNRGRESLAPLAPVRAPIATTATAPEQFDDWGYSPDGIHAETGTPYSPDGWNIWGYDARGISHTGWHENGSNMRTGRKHDENGFDVTGFDKMGLNSETGTSYNSEGYDLRGFSAAGEGRSTRDRDGFNVRGFNEAGIHFTTGNATSPEGFNAKDIHVTTDTYRDPEGFGRDGWNAQGLHRETRTQWNPNGFDANRIHSETGTRYDDAGLTHLRFGKAGRSERDLFHEIELLARRERDFPKPGDPARKTPAEVWTSPRERRAAASAVREASHSVRRPARSTTSGATRPATADGKSSVFGNHVTLYMPGASDETRENLAAAIRGAYLKR